MTPIYETKFAPLTLTTPPDANGRVEGYAALFGEPDRGGDIVAAGAFAETLQNRPASVKFLWQHDPAQPIGIWDSITEDQKGLRVRGRLLTTLKQGEEAATLLAAGALDGLSIGFRTVKAERAGSHRRLTRIELWEISLVTFPMADRARLTPARQEDATALAAAIRTAASAFA